MILMSPLTWIVLTLMYSLKQVIAGTEIGRVASATACTPPNYIHLSMKKTKPNRLASILDSALNDNPTEADLAAKEGYVDPSNYLAKRPLATPQWIQVCDDFKLDWKVWI